MRTALAAALLAMLAAPHASAQCAPAPDSAYFFRGLSEQRAEARIAADRSAYDKLLGQSFTARDPDGKALSREDFIADEMRAAPAAGGHRFFSIRDYTLLEHRKGHTVASYLLIEGTTGKGAAPPSELRVRETYAVQDGLWRLVSVERAPVDAEAAAQAAR